MTIGLNEVVWVVFLVMGILFLKWEDRKKWYLYVGIVSLIMALFALSINIATYCG